MADQSANSARPYRSDREDLYSIDELMDGYSHGNLDASLDRRIQRHFTTAGGTEPDEGEALAQRLHDHHIDLALYRLVRGTDAKSARKVVGIMGGHSQTRDSEHYERTVHLAWRLTRAGFFVASGGGLGIMEAANLGAFLANSDESAISVALSDLRKVPDYKGHEEDYFTTAVSVRDRFGPGAESLAIPTWIYPDEPISQFASHIAKYFANSIREDGLLAVAAYGVVFAPGGAGTLQEVFQDSAQNAYWAFNAKSRMAFMGKQSYTDAPSIYALLQHQAAKYDFADLVTISDEPTEIVEFLSGGPRPKPGTSLNERSFGPLGAPYGLSE